MSKNILETGFLIDLILWVGKSVDLKSQIQSPSFGSSKDVTNKAVPLYSKFLRKLIDDKIQCFWTSSNSSDHWRINGSYPAVKSP